MNRAGRFALALACLMLLLPMIITLANGSRAVFFQATAEHRRLLFDRFRIGSEAVVIAEYTEREALLNPVYQAFRTFECDIQNHIRPERAFLKAEADELENRIRGVFGPFPGDTPSTLLSENYGETRFDRAKAALESICFKQEWVFENIPGCVADSGRLIQTPRKVIFAGTPLEPIFDYLSEKETEILRPRFTFYPYFLTLPASGEHEFGGIFQEITGTLILAAGATVAAAVGGLLIAVCLTELPSGILQQTIQFCIRSLAGVPAIIVALFGFLFFIFLLKLTPGKSLLAGTATLAFALLPSQAHSAAKTLSAIPGSCKMIAHCLGAGKWRVFRSITLPMALPGLLGNIFRGLAQASGAAIVLMLTVQVSMGMSLQREAFFTALPPTLPWSIYTLGAHHPHPGGVCHTGWGMSAVLILLVLLFKLISLGFQRKMAQQMHRLVVPVYD